MKINPIGHLVKTNPIKANFRKGEIDAKCVFIKGYRKKVDFLVQINKPNSQNAKNECKFIYYNGL